jgi:hypothetical protein
LIVPEGVTTFGTDADCSLLMATAPWPVPRATRAAATAMMAVTGT